VNASSMPSATLAALWMVRASLETGAKIGGWSSSCRLPVPQRLAGARQVIEVTLRHRLPDTLLRDVSEGH